MGFQYFTASKTDDNRYLFVSDLHGSTKQFPEIADAAQTSEIVFLLGDVIGTQSLADLQKLFYNSVVNPAKKLLLGSNPDASDDELLQFINPENKETILAGYQQLQNYLESLDNQNHHQDPAADIRQMTEYQHFGHWVGNLPQSIRNVLKHDLDQNAITAVNLMNQLVKNGTLVVVIEGNWDARTPLDFFPGKKCLPIPISQRSFYFHDTIIKRGLNIHHGIKYYHQPGVIETSDCFFVIWPFDATVTPTQVPEIENRHGKKIVVVSHAQVSWKAVKGDTSINSENQAIEQNMPMVITDLRADAMVHGHLHQPFPNNVSGYIFDNHTLVHYLPLDTNRFIRF